MDHELIKLIISEGKIYATDPETLINEEQLNNQTNLINPKVVSSISDILTEILINCHDSKSGTKYGKNVEKSLVTLLYSWCQISEDYNHDIYNTRTLKILLTAVDQKFKRKPLSGEELQQHRENLKAWNNVAEDKINRSWKLNVQKRREKVLREEVSGLFVKEKLKNTLIQVPNRTRHVVEDLSTQEQAVKEDETDMEELVNLGMALNNLETDLVQNLMLSVLYDVKNLEPVQHLFKIGIENSETGRIYLENVPAIIEEELLQFTYQICSKIDLQSILHCETDLKYFITIKTKVYELLSSNKNILNIFKYCLESKSIFQTTSSILNQLLIHTKFDLRILSLTQNFIDAVNSMFKPCFKPSEIRLVNLYPERLKDLVFHLDLTPNFAKTIGVFDKTLEKIFELYLDSSSQCLLLLSHYCLWIEKFHDYFTSTML